VELQARIACDLEKTQEQQWSAFLEAVVVPQADLVQMLVGQAVEQAENLAEMSKALTSLEFFRRTVATLVQDDSSQARSCSVCLEEDIPLNKLAITPCAHTFCNECLEVSVQKFRCCSICRRQLSTDDIRLLSVELSRSVQNESIVESQGSETKYGSKLALLVMKLRELRHEDPRAKVILFVQFDDLKRKVAAALEEFGIPSAQLQGTVSQRTAVIDDWQDNHNSNTFVLMLSLSQSASGTNLTAASHVVFLHPMLSERATEHELQAIGRARQAGQKRDVVHVWRFVTVDTIEQLMTERNQAGL